MAKAVAKCTCKTCGKTFIMETVKSSRRDADIWEKWAVSYYDECDDCKQKRREDTAAQLAAEAKEAGLPELTGTPKQLVWAEQLRATFADNADKFIDETNETLRILRHRIEIRTAKGKEVDDLLPKEKELAQFLPIIPVVKNYLLHSKTDASWWIDTRYTAAEDIVKRNKDAAIDAEAESETC